MKKLQKFYDGGWKKNEPQIEDCRLDFTVLDNTEVSCFSTGGEKRLLIPELLNKIFKDFEMEQMNKACENLNINFTYCTDLQLENLIEKKILSVRPKSCGLIKKTDAERLCNFLLHSNARKAELSHSESPYAFQVYHECFGKCRGILNPKIYNTPTSPCIKCAECDLLFSPQKFVSHSHKPNESKTCHWGFESDNWRYYLMLADRQIGRRDLLERTLEEVKAKFDPNSTIKRKTVDPEEAYSKKVRIETHQVWTVTQQTPSKKKLNTVRTYKKPPPLVNPERVIPFTCEEQHVVPNVELAPQRRVSPSTYEFTSSDSGSDLSPSSPDENTIVDARKYQHLKSGRPTGRQVRQTPTPPSDSEDGPVDILDELLFMAQYGGQTNNNKHSDFFTLGEKLKTVKDKVEKELNARKEATKNAEQCIHQIRSQMKAMMARTANEISNVKAKYKGQAEHFRKRAVAAEQQNIQLQTELARAHEQIGKYS